MAEYSQLPPPRAQHVVLEQIVEQDPDGLW